MATVWASAWEEGEGKNIDEAALAAVDLEELKALYNRKDFVPSFQLTNPKFAASLQGE